MQLDPLVGQAVNALVATDPRSAAKAVLPLVADATGAAAAALLEFRSGNLGLVFSRDADQDVIDAAREAWAKRPDRLRAGEMVRHETCVVIPISRGERVVGLLSIASPREDALEATVAALEPVLASVITAKRSVESTHPGPKLQELLEQHEWNIARVARILGVTRKTIYDRLDRFRIPRKKVSRWIG